MSKFASGRLLRNQWLTPVLIDPKRLQKGVYLANVTMPAGDLLRALFGNVMVWTAPAPASRSMKSCAKTVVVEQPSEGAPS
ncbi:MAG: hypothetical protein WA624_11390, partial [Methylocella sp.]